MQTHFKHMQICGRMKRQEQKAVKVKQESFLGVEVTVCTCLQQGYFPLNDRSWRSCRLSKKWVTFLIWLLLLTAAMHVQACVCLC